jgi:hypothetical protein
MSSRHLTFPTLLFSITLLTACGGKGNSSSSSDPPGATPQSLGMFSGTYAFLVADRGCVCTFAAAGSLKADGAGKVSSGVMDINYAGSVQNNVAVSGTYTVDIHGRGSANLKSSGGTYAFRFVILSATHAFVIGFDTYENASGTMDLQDSSAFSVAGLAGSFAFLVSGTDAAGEALQIGGAITSNTSGNISSGIEDVHDNQVIETALSIAPAPISVAASSGRGVFSLSSSFGTSDYAFYVVDANHLKLIGMDAGTILDGDAYLQKSSSSSQIAGSYAFTTFGWTSGLPLPLSAGGVFLADSSGNIASGTEDQNNNGSVAQNLQLSGTYTVASNGRGTLTLNTSSGTTSFAIYPSVAGIQLLEIDSSGTTDGMAFLQQASSFSSASLNGNFGLSTTGSSAGEISDQLAALSADGNGNVAGTMDLNNERSPEAGLSVKGSYSISSNGRGTTTLTTSAGISNLNIYTVDSSLTLALSLDTTSVMVGSLEQN